MSRADGPANYDTNPVKFEVEFIDANELENRPEKITGSFVFVTDNDSKLLSIKNEV